MESLTGRLRSISIMLQINIEKEKLNVCDGRFATAPLIYAGSCPKPEFGRFMLENVRNSGVENVRRCRTSSKPKKVQIWHFPLSAFEVGNSPTLMNGVGKCQTVISSPMVSFYQLENVRRSQIVIWWVCTWWKMSDGHRKSIFQFLFDGKCQTVVKKTHWLVFIWWKMSHGHK